MAASSGSRKFAKVLSGMSMARSFTASPFSCR